MTEVKNSVKETKKKKKNNLLMIILLSIAALLFVIFGGLYFNSSKELKELKKEKQSQKEYFEGELSTLMIEHNKVKTEYSMIADSLSLKDSIIEANALELKKMLNYKWDFYKVQKKIKALRKVAQGYLVQIDSLYRINADLAEENKEIKTKFKKEKLKNEELAVEKQKLNKLVETASELSIYNISTEGVKLTWFDNEKPTDKANRTEKIKICFTVGENKILKSGPQNIYFRIADPTKKIFTSTTDVDAYTFEWEGQVMQYTIKDVIDYNGESIDKCVYWMNPNNKKSLAKGQYTIDIYSDNAKIGQTYLNLK